MISEHTDASRLEVYTIKRIIFSGDKSRAQTGIEVIKLVSCSTQLSMEFQLLIECNMMKIIFCDFKLSDVVFSLLINVKIPTIVGI